MYKLPTTSKYFHAVVSQRCYHVSSVVVYISNFWDVRLETNSLVGVARSVNFYTYRQDFEGCIVDQWSQSFCNRGPVNAWQFYRGPGALYDFCYFSTSVWSYQFETSDKAAAVEFTAPLHLQRSHFMFQRSHSMHVTVLPWEKSANHMPR